MCFCISMVSHHFNVFNSREAKTYMLCMVSSPKEVYRNQLGKHFVAVNVVQVFSSILYEIANIL